MVSSINYFLTEQKNEKLINKDLLFFAYIFTLIFSTVFSGIVIIVFIFRNSN